MMYTVGGGSGPVNMGSSRYSGERRFISAPRRKRVQWWKPVVSALEKIVLFLGMLAIIAMLNLFADMAIALRSMMG